MVVQYSTFDIEIPYSIPNASNMIQYRVKTLISQVFNIGYDISINRISISEMFDFDIGYMP